MDQAAVKLLQQGFALQKQGNFDAAEQHYHKVLAAHPHNEFALNLLGVVALRREEFDKAVSFLQRAARANSRDPDTFSNLGLAFKEQGEFEQACTAFEKALSLKPNPVTANNLGNSRAALGDHRKAAECFQAALRMQPDYPDCMLNFARTLIELRDFTGVNKLLSAVEQRQPRNAELFCIRGESEIAQSHFDEALPTLKQVLELDPTSNPARLALSTAAKQLGDAEQAEQLLRDALSQEPDNAEAHTHLGVLMEQLGRFDAAAASFREAIARNGKQASAYYQLSKLKEHGLGPSELENIERLLGDQSLHAILRGPLLFALATHCEKQGDYSRSLELFKEGNRIRAAGARYDRDIERQYAKFCEETFPAPAAGAASGQQDQTPAPIFVVGMPRSGTTLTAQILSAHSKVENLGEVSFISDLAMQASKITGQPFPQCCGFLDEQALQTLQEGYRKRARLRWPAAEFVVDKTPMNFNFIGFIRQIFPEAPIIYCKRNAMDNCLSIFKLPFDENQSYSHDLTALGQSYCQHEAIMALWKTLYPDEILESSYEEVVADPEARTRQMLDFIGLPFEPEVLEFYRRDSMVLTPSAEQVRQPIYRTSVDKWKRYGDGLKPLQDALAAG
ncbi:tetratricopeptide repeat-containing sulfotransferase family protein [Biformimicrobium ophioploci]|uniref:Sulfotransferase n=1 Tax=Biformimicrobium ophioploci TaxID=3036711 RepID=A0ABQ6M0S1_9GAMM|nr:tetratricopeptide repeat-containing sulfotransferase family protein [Microbulbifer sp. NKW57]GMG87944.1 sulfotransferase [Microbulbifer sp. NKW57]